MPPLKKKTKNKALMLKIDVPRYFHSSPRMKNGILFAKMVNNFKSINIFAKNSISEVYGTNSFMTFIKPFEIEV